MSLSLKNPDLMHKAVPIGGRRIAADANGFAVTNPVTEDLLSHVPNLGQAETMEAIDAARIARKNMGCAHRQRPTLSLISFRCPGDDADQQRLADAINEDGRIYLTQGEFQGRKVIRFQVGQFDTTRDDVMMAHMVIQEVWGQVS